MHLLDLLQEGFEFRTEEFYCPVTGSTDDMMVLEAVGLIPQSAIPVVHSACQATFFQQLQRPVYGSKADTRILLLTNAYNSWAERWPSEARNTSQCRRGVWTASDFCGGESLRGSTSLCIPRTPFLGENHPGSFPKQPYVGALLY